MEGSRGVAQLLQNRALSVFTKSHLGHLIAITDPYCFEKNIKESGSCQLDIFLPIEEGCLQGF